MIEMANDSDLPHDTIPLRVAQHVIDILNDATELEGDEAEKIEFLLASLQRLLNRRTFCAVMLLEDLQRKPTPHYVRRFTYSPSSQYGPIFDETPGQQVMDEVEPLMKLVIPQIMAAPGNPCVIVCAHDSKDRHPEWVRDTFVPLVRSHGYEDFMMAAWSASPDRAILMNISQTQGTPPFTEADRDTMSLMLRAAAPFVDRELFHAEILLEEYNLTDREREVLLCLLAGEHPKEIARHLRLSVHTIRSFVKHLYVKIDVSSRGELMAHFVDESLTRAATRQHQRD
jgi:DNA-binding CsgD family transcriptional regulator